MGHKQKMDGNWFRASQFSGQDRRRLGKACRETHDLSLFRRCQAVLRVAEGYSVTEAARQAGVNRSSVHRWVELYLQNHQPQDLLDRPRSGRPREADDLDQELLAAILAQDPQQLGYCATTWTVPLLATHLREECDCPVSARTVRRRLHEFDYGWKRPRYVYHERDPHVAQKKGRWFAA
jgi:transposase